MTRHVDATQSAYGLQSSRSSWASERLLPQLDCDPISQEQLAEEVNEALERLTAMETECCNAVPDQVGDAIKQPLEPWNVLVDMHNTLIHEHHDFLIASQHPTANSSLSSLATEQDIPARLWKHGIYNFLEALRHARPQSQDFMLQFIAIAYQTLTSLLETVPSFKDTWTECLGDLSRYRMAIEEEQDTHTFWRNIAAEWYKELSARHPGIGRTYLHLGMLEEPSLRKLCLYAVSLTCQEPFVHAQDSLSQLCQAIVQDVAGLRSSSLAEHRVLTSHAMLITGSDLAETQAVSVDALELFRGQLNIMRRLGVHLAVVNASALFEFGSSWPQLKTKSIVAQAEVDQVKSHTQESHQLADQYRRNLSLSFWTATFNTFMQQRRCLDVRDSLPSVHAYLACIHALNAPWHVKGGHYTGMVHEKLHWEELVDYLNEVLQEVTVRSGVPCHLNGSELSFYGDVHLEEDDMLRGLAWAQPYFESLCLPPRGHRDVPPEVSSENSHRYRCQRVLWLGIRLARYTPFLEFNVDSMTFSMETMAGDMSELGNSVPLAHRQTSKDSVKAHGGSSSDLIQQGYVFIASAEASCEAIGQ